MKYIYDGVIMPIDQKHFYMTPFVMRES